MIASAATSAPVSKRGRPRVSSDPCERRKHLEVASLMLGTKLPAKRIAAMYQVTRVTVYNWLGLALTYEEAEADVLRRLAGLSARNLPN